MAWRERLATAREARVAVERKNRCSLAYIDAVGGFGMIATYAVSRQSVLRDKIQYMKGVGRGLASDAGVQSSLSLAVARYETVRGTFTVFAAVCAGSLVACLALATPHGGASRARSRAFPVPGVLVQICVRFFFAHHRFTLNATVRSVERATGASFAGRLGEESLFRRRPSSATPGREPCTARRLCRASRRSSTTSACASEPREHALFHALAVLVRFAQDEHDAQGMTRT